jgi:hypothetical protein
MDISWELSRVTVEDSRYIVRLPMTEALRWWRAGWDIVQPKRTEEIPVTDVLTLERGIDREKLVFSLADIDGDVWAVMFPKLRLRDAVTKLSAIPKAGARYVATRLLWRYSIRGFVYPYYVYLRGDEVRIIHARDDFDEEEALVADDWVVACVGEREETHPIFQFGRRVGVPCNKDYILTTIAAAMDEDKGFSLHDEPAIYLAAVPSENKTFFYKLADPSVDLLTENSETSRVMESYHLKYCDIYTQECGENYSRGCSVAGAVRNDIMFRFQQDDMDINIYKIKVL